MRKKHLIVLLLVGLFIAGGCKRGAGDRVVGDEVCGALPKGMTLVWNDEFNDGELDRRKWVTQYYSQFDYISRTNREDFRSNNLPEPGMIFTDSTIILITNDEMPERTYWENGRKISSIQTYDWNSDRLTFDNRRGGYMTARIRRDATPDAKQVNGAFWLDSPGPDPRYFVEEGNEALGVKGIRPRGQVFEVDLCEYINTEIVLHGNVSPEGEFERNIGHHIVKGDFYNRWTEHSMLWTPAGLKFYVDGELVREWWDEDDIKSPNHAMVIFLGAYGNGGTVSLECDYVRFYQWELEGENELPNGGFEYDGALFPWEGDGTVSSKDKRSGAYGLVLEPGESVSQYVYVDPMEDYKLSYYAKGNGGLEAKVEAITAVSGEVLEWQLKNHSVAKGFEMQEIEFTSRPDHEGHLQTVRVTFKNVGEGKVVVDDVELKK